MPRQYLNGNEIPVLLSIPLTTFSLNSMPWLIVLST